MYQTLFPSDLFAELDKLQREIQRFTGPTTSIRGLGRNGFPALNVAGSPDAVEIYAFAPGLDTKTIDVTVERGVLSLSGERPGVMPKEDSQSSVHMNERFSGRFRRAVSLPDDVDPGSVTANYSDGVLHVSVKRRESAKPRSIAVQIH